jgi:hypothetical protein
MRSGTVVMSEFWTDVPRGLNTCAEQTLKYAAKLHKMLRDLVMMQPVPRSFLSMETTFTA